MNRMLTIVNQPEGSLTWDAKAALKINGHEVLIRSYTIYGEGKPKLLWKVFVQKTQKEWTPVARPCRWWSVASLKTTQIFNALRNPLCPVGAPCLKIAMFTGDSGRFRNKSQLWRTSAPESLGSAKFPAHGAPIGQNSPQGFRTCITSEF